MNKFLSFVIIFCFGFTSACTPGATQIPTHRSTAITVMAAASLKEPFNEMGILFEERYSGTQVIFNLAGSQQLAQQLVEGAPADVFASANQKQMEIAVAAGRVNPGSPKPFARNRLIVILPKDNPGSIVNLIDLSKPGLKLVLPAQDVPAGQYSLEFLNLASGEKELGVNYQANALQNVVSYEDNVKAVLTKITLGEADAGIVYSSDTSGEAGQNIQQIEIPEAWNVIASYPISPLNDSLNPDLAQAFVNLVFSDAGQQILAKYGFMTISE